ncbi:hypothetical protein HFD88_004690 [Aspergillus terreus]|nr:hypothetical protein HFD88_004690 [Aspergillus terreus]
MEVTWRFHHENWDEPWASDDFPVGESKQEIRQRIRRLKSEPWWDDTTNTVVRFLHDELPYQWPWGYTIYRTVYTPESSQHWKATTEAIPKHVYASAKGQLNNEKPSRIFQEGYRPLIFDDQAQFDGATLDEVRRHFKAIRNSDNGDTGVRFRFCLVIDEGALQSIIQHPEPQKPSRNGAWVTVIDPDYTGGGSYNTRYYLGYFRIHLNDLWRLTYLEDALELDEVCGKMKGPDDIPWFDSDI